MVRQTHEKGAAVAESAAARRLATAGAGHRRGACVPAHRRGQVVRGRDLDQGRRPLDLPVSGGRSVRSSYRRTRLDPRDAAAARSFFARALRVGCVQVEITTDRAPVYPRVLDELQRAPRQVTERYANNRVEADHGRLKARLRPMCGLKRLASVCTIAAGHAFVQNLRRGHYAITNDLALQDRVRVAVDELALCL
jgi:DDE domain